ncbi:MAG: flagellar hook-length control protein FliK [Pseudolabrys sp.]|nr:flagellar hook-length control protein FliK [Pseudolabrys sp.]MDP2298548.1 flagellar hook-length control protein FliK [Pseudolabrys sp.]
MAHVASDLKSQMLNRLQSQAGRPSSASDRSATTAFDSILDETARPAPEPRSQRAADDKPPRADRSDRPDRTKPADRPERATKSDNSAKSSEAVATTDTAELTASDGKSGEAATAERTVTEGETKTAETAAQAGETKPAEAAAPEAIAVVIDPAIAATTAQVNAELDTKAAAIAATAAAAKTAEATPDTASEAGADSALADAMPDALAALAAKTDKKTDDKPALAAKADAKSEGKTDGKAQTTLHADAAVQAATAAEPHKDAGSHAGAEETANNHRGVATDSPAAATADKTAAATVMAKAADLAPPPTLMAVQAPAHAAQTQGVAALGPSARTETTTPAVPVAGVAFEITSKVMAGKNQFDIRLDPAELGRIHVRLDVDRDGNVVTHMIADRPDTLDMLRRDTAGLERALQDAGLKTSDNSLQFSLRDQQQQQQQNNNGSNTANVVVEDEQMTHNEPAARNYTRYSGQPGGLDIRV